MNRRQLVFVVTVILFAALGFSLRQTPPAKVILQQLESQVMQSSPSPIPSPTPVIAHDPSEGVITPPIEEPAPVITPPTAEPTTEAFPAPAKPKATPGQPTPPPIPETMVTVSTAPPMPKVDPHTGGFACVAPCTIVWWACFQGGFMDSNVQLCGPNITDKSLTFVWSDGSVGPVNSATYNAPGVYKMTLTVTETYNGHKYGAGSTNAVPVTVT